MTKSITILYYLVFAIGNLPADVLLKHSIQNHSYDLLHATPHDTTNEGEYYFTTSPRYCGPEPSTEGWIWMSFLIGVCAVCAGIVVAYLLTRQRRKERP